jgi:uncharacterized protein (DUF1697 family)
VFAEHATSCQACGATRAGRKVAPRKPLRYGADVSPRKAEQPTDGKYVALLRAVNVGGRNKIAMARLRELLEGLGYGEVRTHLQSGNAVFTADGSSPGRVTNEVEGALASEAGLVAKVLVRTRAELERVVAENPLLDLAGDHARLLVTFLSQTPDRDLLGELAPADFEPDVFAVGEREIYVWYPEGVRATKLSNAFWEKRLGVIATGRNWNTVTRLLELAGE